MNSQINTALQLSTNDAILRLDFEKQSDRFAHKVVRIAGESETVLIRSVEGTAEQHWPSSPPFQDLSIEPIKGENAALLVGMAGTSHWSMSVTCAEEQGDQVGWVFDVACRIKETPQWLGTNYEVLEEGNVEVQPLNQCELEKSVQNQDATKENHANQLIQIRCTHEIVGIPQTLQWKYALLFPR